MKIGVITDCFKKSHVEGIEEAYKLGLDGVQIYAVFGDFSPQSLTDEKKTFYKQLLKEKNLVISALCGDMGGFGFEVEEENPQKIQKTKEIIDLAEEFDIKIITTHIGVIPSDKANPKYAIMLKALTEIGLYAKSKGIIIADTKFEFGLDEDGNLVLADEVLTPDSSRFWPADDYEIGRSQKSFDKQYMRDWLTSNNWDPANPTPIPEDVVNTTREKYIGAYEKLTGKKF